MIELIQKEKRFFHRGRIDALVLILFLPVFVWVFGSHCSKLGIYADDAAFLVGLSKANFWQTLEAARAYVPGREMHIIWQKLLFLMAGTSPASLPCLHLLQTLLDALCVVIFFVILRKLEVPVFASVVGMVVFAFYPDHGETHFWLSSAPMNIMSTVLFQAYLLWVICHFRGIAGAGATTQQPLDFAIECLLFLCALFTYDQVFFCMFMIAGLRIWPSLFKQGWRRFEPWACSLFYTITGVLYLLHKINPATGPTLREGLYSRFMTNLHGAFWLADGGARKLILGQAVTRPDAKQCFLAASILTVVVFALLAIAAWSDFVSKRVDKDKASAGLRKLLLTDSGLLALCVVGWFAAYAPACMWGLSERHHYFPTVFLAGGAAILTGLMTKLLARVPFASRWSPSALCAFVCVYTCLFTYRGVACALLEKGMWIENYQSRVGFYHDLNDKGLFNNVELLVLDGFPGYLGSTSYFFYESAQAINYLVPETGGALHWLSLTAYPGIHGVYADTEQLKFGGPAFTYHARARTLWLKYDGRTGSTIKYEKVDEVLSDLIQYRATNEAPAAEPVGNPPVLANPITATESSPGSLAISFGNDVDKERLAPGEAIACLLYEKQSDNGIYVAVSGNKTGSGEPTFAPLTVLERDGNGLYGVSSYSLKAGDEVKELKALFFKVNKIGPVPLGSQIVTIGH